MSSPGNALGWLAGLVSSPATGLISALRRSRMFHPSGLLFQAEVEAVPGSAAAAGVAARLVGPALVRWSSALWKEGATHGGKRDGKRAERPDVLGCAIRFSQAPLGTQPKPEDQDLLLATIQRPWSMPFAPATTRQHDFLANYYYGVSPFQVPPLGRIEWRLVPEAPRRGELQLPASMTRAERLAAALQAGSAHLLLEWAPYSGPLRRPAAELFTPLVRLALTAELELDQEALRFHPFRMGRGIEPVGFVHAMRRATYLTSQALRPGHEAPPPLPAAAPLLPKTPRT
jgi:hypothetical protein